MKKSVLKVIDDVKGILKATGWSEDKWGNYQKTVNGREYRMKFNDTSVRYEVKIRFSDGSSEWSRIKSGYYKDLSVVDGKIRGLK